MRGNASRAAIDGTAFVGSRTLGKYARHPRAEEMHTGGIVENALLFAGRVGQRTALQARGDLRAHRIVAASGIGVAAPLLFALPTLVGLR